MRVIIWQIWSTPLSRALSEYRAAGTLTRISEIHKQEKIDVILPTLDSELDNYIQIESELRYLGIRMLLPQKDSLAMRDKPTLSEKIPADIVNTPQTLRVSDVAALREACEDLSKQPIKLSQTHCPYCVLFLFA